MADYHLKDTLFSMHSELLAYQAGSPRRLYLQEYRDYCDGELQTAFYGMYDTANTIIDYGSDASYSLDEPKYMLTRRTLEALQSSHHPDTTGISVCNTACFQSEIYFARSIQRLADPAAEHMRKGLQLPAAVLFGDDGEPFAYHKADGTPLALAWRTAAYTTEEDTFTIAAGSIFETVYGRINKACTFYEQDPRLACIGDASVGHLVSAKNAPKPETVVFWRMMTDILPLKARSFIHAQAAETKPNLQPYIDRAVHLRPSEVWRSAHQYMTTQHVPNL